jgi:hypothetical protein
MSRLAEEIKEMLRLSRWLKEFHAEAYEEYLAQVEAMNMGRWFSKHHPEIIEEWDKGVSHVGDERSA